MRLGLKCLAGFDVVCLCLLWYMPISVVSKVDTRDCKVLSSHQKMEDLVGLRVWKSSVLARASHGFE